MSILEKIEGFVKSLLRNSRRLFSFFKNDTPLPPGRREIASRFRSGEYQKGYPDLRLQKELARSAKEWNGALDDFEEEEIQEGCRYQQFAALLQKDSRLQEKFFAWALRDHNPVDAFILFPEIVDDLIEKGLSSRLGFYGARHLEVSKDRQDIFIMVEGKWRSLLNQEEEIIFRSGRTSTLKEIIYSFGNKWADVGDFELFEEGVIPWNTLSWSRISEPSCPLLQKDWYKKLPLLRRISRGEAEMRYHKMLSSEESVVAAYATRDSKTLDFRGTHAFLELAVYQKDGSYLLYNFGKFAKKFPKNGFETFKMLCQNAVASIAYPDENIFYSTREHALFPFVVSENEIETLFEAIQEDFLQGQKGRLIYQIESENCAKWVFEKLSMIIPETAAIQELFFLPLLETEPLGPVRTIFEGIKKLPKSWQVPILGFFHLFLGASQTTWVEEEGELVGKSLIGHSFFYHGKVFLPALLVHKVAEEFGAHLWRVMEKTYGPFVFFDSTQVFDNKIFANFKPSVSSESGGGRAFLPLSLWHTTCTYLSVGVSYGGKNSSAVFI